MIVVTVTLVSAVSRDRDRVLGEMTICNVGGTATRGEYLAKTKARTGRVSDYPRKEVSMWNLLRRSLEACGYNK